MEKATLVFLCCVLWDAILMLYTRVSATAKRDAKGFSNVFLIAGLYGIVSIIGLRLAVPNGDLPTGIAWVAGTAIGAAVGLAISGGP